MANGSLNHYSNVVHDFKIVGNKRLSKAHNSGTMRSRMAFVDLFYLIHGNMIMFIFIKN